MKIKRLISIILAVSLILSVQTVIFANAATTAATSFTFDANDNWTYIGEKETHTYLRSNNGAFSLGFNDSVVTVAGSQAPTNTAYSIATEAGVGGKNINDTSLVWNTNGTIANVNKSNGTESQPFLIIARAAALPLTAQANIEFDMYLTNTVFNNTTSQNIFTFIIQGLNSDGSNDVTVQVPWKPANGSSSNIKPFDNSLGWQNNDVLDADILNGWHRFLITAEPTATSGTIKFSLYVDGTLVTSSDLATSLVSLTGLRIKQRLTGLTANTTTVNNKLAFDNIKIYDGSAASALPENTLYTTDKASQLTIPTGTTFGELKTAIGSSKTVSSSLSDSTALSPGDRIIVSDPSVSAFYENYYILTEQAQGSIDMSFDYDGTTMLVGSGTDTNGKAVDYNYLENGWTFSNTGSDSLTSGATGFNTTHKVNLLNGLGNKDSDDKALAIVTKNYTAGNGADSPAIQYRNNLYDSYGKTLYNEFDVYFDGTVAKNELFVEYLGETSSGSSIKKQFFAAFFADGKVTFNGTQIANNFTFGEWHNILITYNPTAQTVAMRIDGVDYPAVSIASSDVAKYTGYSRMKVVQRFAGLTEAADAISAVDNFRLYTIASLPQLTLTSSDEDVVILDTAEKIIVKNNADVASAISAADGVKIDITSSTVTLSNTLYEKTYGIISTNDNLVYLDPVYMTDPDDDENMTVTARAIYTGAETSAVALLGGYPSSGDSILKSVGISDYDSVSCEDVISVSQIVEKDCADNFKFMVWNSFDELSPLEKNAYEFKVQRPISLYMAGDSLMQAYGTNYYPQQGWAEYFKYQLDPTVTTMYNVARGGESTRSYYYQLFDERILDRIQPGDWALFSFCHNDRYSTREGTDSDGNTFTYKTTEDEYAEYLQKFIDEVEAKGANVIFVTGPNTGNKLYQHENYPAVMQTVASNNGIECVDLYNIHNNYIKTVDKTLVTGDDVPESVRKEMFLYKLVEQGVLTEAQKSAHPNANVASYDSDLTHFSEKGASMLANWAANAIKDNNLTLKGYLK